jgi:hypothetical protein
MMARRSRSRGSGRPREWSMAAGPSAAKATSGLLEHMTKSALANRSAMASLSWRRYDSIEAAFSSVYRCMAAFSPARISGQFIDPVGVGAPQVGHESHLSGHRPLARAMGGRLGRDVDHLQAGRFGQMLGGGRDQIGHLVAHPGHTEVGEDGHLHPGQVVGFPARPPIRPPRAGSGDHADRTRCRRRSSGPCPEPTE